MRVQLWGELVHTYHLCIVSSSRPKAEKMAAPSGGGLLVSKLQSEKSGSIALARRAGRTRARALTRRYDFEKPSSTRSSSMNVNKGYVLLGHTRARGRGRVWGGPSGSEFVLASLLACLAWLPTPAHSTHSPKHERTYVRVYHFRARALQIYHPAREKRRKAIFVLLGLCSRRCSGQGWFHLHSSKFSLSSRCN